MRRDRPWSRCPERGHHGVEKRKGDAVAFEDELRRRRRLGDLVGFAGAQETLNRYVADTWAKTHAVTLAPKTAKHYASLYDLHIEPYPAS